MLLGLCGWSGRPLGHNGSKRGRVEFGPPSEGLRRLLAALLEHSWRLFGPAFLGLFWAVFWPASDFPSPSEAK
eukprot:4871456-Pyramimonas_sp.AAC.1